MKILILILSLFIFSLSFAGISDLGKQMESRMEKARKCYPELTKDGFKFCTGNKLSTDQLNELYSLDQKQCLKKIENYGYKLVFKSNKTEFKSFINSTQKALVLHDKKLAFFKEGSNRNDCIHEYIHLFERYNCSGELCPAQREHTGDLFRTYLNKEVDKIAAHEKNGKVALAKKKAKALTKYIKLYGDWEKMIDWFDEKEAHFFMFSNCDQLQCSIEDYEIALTNLFRLKKYFPATFNSYIVSKSREILAEKELRWVVENEKKWNKLNPLVVAELQRFYKMKQKEKLSFLKKKKVTLKKAPLLAKKGTKKNKLFDTLPTLSFRNKHIIDNFDVKHFNKWHVICEKKSPYIILANTATDLDLFEAYSFLVFSKENKELCSISKNENQLTAKFNSGKLSRKIYEDEVMRNRSYKRLFYKNHFSMFFSSIDFSDKMFNKLYSQKLLSEIPSKHTITPRIGLILKYSEVNDLPGVLVKNKVFALDFGAMDSVAPLSFFNREHVTDSLFLKELSLQYTNRVVQKAPKVLISYPLVIAGETVSNTTWALVNEMPFKEINGILGFDFFSSNDFVIDLERKRIVFSDQLGEEMPENALKLSADFGNQYRALEFYCPDGSLIRLDTGSQVLGDLSYKIGKDNYIKIIEGDGLQCGNLNFKGKFETKGNQSIIFSRGVVLNLGWPWIKQFDQINVSLTNGWIEFVKNEGI